MSVVLGYYGMLERILRDSRNGDEDSHHHHHGVDGTSGATDTARHEEEECRAYAVVAQREAVAEGIRSVRMTPSEDIYEMKIDGARFVYYDRGELGRYEPGVDTIDGPPSWSESLPVCGWDAESDVAADYASLIQEDVHAFRDGLFLQIGRVAPSISREKERLEKYFGSPDVEAEPVRSPGAAEKNVYPAFEEMFGCMPYRDCWEGGEESGSKSAVARMSNSGLYIELNYNSWCGRKSDVKPSAQFIDLGDVEGVGRVRAHDYTGDDRADHLSLVTPDGVRVEISAYQPGPLTTIWDGSQEPCYNVDLVRGGVGLFLDLLDPLFARGGDMLLEREV